MNHYEDLLREKGYEINEAALIDILERGQDMAAAHYASMLLRQYGTAAAVPSLRKAMTFPIKDVKIVSFFTIAMILKESGTSFYIETLQQPGYREKWATICVIGSYSDSSAIPAVMARVKQLKAKKTEARGEIAYDGRRGSELDFAVFYLAKFRDTNPEVARLFQQYELS